MQSTAALSVEAIAAAAAPLLRELGAARAVLFGSRARGDASAASDVDILIEFPGVRSVPVGMIKWLRAENEIAERLGVEVQLLSSTGASPAVLEEIAAQGIELYVGGA